jgi:hypothetical protein
MPSATTPDPGPPFDAGRALAESFSILAANVGALVLMTLGIHLPVLAIQLYLIAAPAVAARAQPSMALLMGAGMFFTALSTGAVTHATLQQLEGKPAPVSECLRAAISRAAVILVINFVTLVAVFFGTLAFVVPGLFAATVLFLAAPVAMAEGLGFVGAIQRSIELTRGARWGILGLWIMPIALVMGLHLVALRAFVDLTAEHPLEDGRFQAVSAVLSVLFQALSAVTMAVAYRKLRGQAGGAKPDFGPGLD